MENKTSLKQVCKDQAEFRKNLNGGTSDPDIIIDKLSEGNDKGNKSCEDDCIQVISQIGYDMRDDQSDDNIAKCMERLHRLIQNCYLSFDREMNILNILEGYWGCVPSELSDLIERKFGEDIRYILDGSVSDKDLINAMRRSNPDMLKRIQER